MTETQADGRSYRLPAILAEIRKLRKALDDIQEGRVVVLPQSLEHAQAMHLVATAALSSRETPA